MNNSIVYTTPLPLNPETKSAIVILGRYLVSEEMIDQPQGLLGEALKEFLLKNADYEDSSDTMGLPGEIAKLDQKVKKLVRSVIQHKPLNGESPRELLHDIFGHCLLAMYYGVREQSEAEESVSGSSSNEEMAIAVSPLDVFRKHIVELYRSFEIPKEIICEAANEVLSQLGPDRDQMLNELRSQTRVLVQNGVPWADIRRVFQEERPSYQEDPPVRIRKDPINRRRAVKDAPQE